MFLKGLFISEMTLPSGAVVRKRRSTAPLIALLVMAGTIASARFTNFDAGMLAERWQQFFVIIGQMIPPNWSYLSNVWEPLAETVKMSLLGSMLGTIAALPVAYLASSNMVRSKTVVFAARVFLSLLRTLPTLVSALIATFVFGLGSTAGTVAIILFTLAYVGKLLYEQIEQADLRPFEAMEALGMRRTEAFRYAIMPQVVPMYLSTALFCFEGNVRYAAILGYVGAGGIGLILQESIGWRNYANVGMILAALILIVIIIESISEHFRKRLT